MPRKKIKKVDPYGDTIRIQTDFVNRFNLPAFMSNHIQFKQRCITNVGIFYTWLSQEQVDDITINVSKLLGMHLKINADFFEKNDNVFEKTRIYEVLKTLAKLPESGYLYMWLMALEVIANTYIKGDRQKIAKNNFASNIAEALELSGINAIICDTPSGYKFYSANAELLDIKSVVDVSNWLSDYPKAKEKYDDALRLFLKGDRTRHVLDDCRLCLELFVKQYLSNEKSLENQISELGKFLKGNGVSAELRNMFTSLINGYTSFNNNNVKHDDKINESEIEFVIYTTGAFMRLLISATGT